MKKILIVSLIALFVSTSALSHPPPIPNQFTKYTVATLPAAASNTGKVVIVSDGNAAGDCTVGTGTVPVFCYSTGAAWAAVGDGTGQAVLTDSAGLRGALSDETGTGAAVFNDTPTLIAPVIGAATGTSLYTTGRIDGLTGVTLSTANAATTISSTSNKSMTYLNQGDSDAHSIYTLPTAAEGLYYCVRNYTGITTVVKFQTSAAGQYIDVDGVNTGSGKAVKSSGALGDSACVQGVDATHWILWMNSGLWSIDNS